MNLARIHQFYMQCLTHMRCVGVVALLVLNAVAFSAPDTIQERGNTERVKTEVVFTNAYKKKKTQTVSYVVQKDVTKSTGLCLAAISNLKRSHDQKIYLFFHHQQRVTPERSTLQQSFLPANISTSSNEDSLPSLNS